MMGSPASLLDFVVYHEGKGGKEKGYLSSKLVIYFTSIIGYLDYIAIEYSINATNMVHIVLLLLAFRS